MKLRNFLLMFYISMVAPALAVENLHENFNSLVVLSKNETWRAARRLHDQRVIVEINYKGKVSTYKPPVPTSVLISASNQNWGDNEYLLTIWQEGVYVTVLRIFDPKVPAQQAIWEKYSLGY